MRTCTGAAPRPGARVRLLLALLIPALGACSDFTAPDAAPPPGANPSRRELTASGRRAYWADGYVWASSPTDTLPYAPGSFYSFNRTGGAIVIHRPAGAKTGRYVVRFQGLSALLGNRSTVHVTGYWNDDRYCKTLGPNLAYDSIVVRCYSATTGALANAYFTLLVSRTYADLAFAFAEQSKNTNYAPRPSASWNPTGPMRIFRSGVGAYQVVFIGLGTLVTTNGGHVQVSAVGGGGAYCSVSSWGGSPDLFVYARCYSATGAPADSPFNVQFILPSEHLVYAWADQPSTYSYTPSTYYSYNPAGPINVTRNAPGLYTVTFQGADPWIYDGGDVQVTAYTGSNGKCKVEGWGPQSVNVRCTAPNGAPLDSSFTILYAS